MNKFLEITRKELTNLSKYKKIHVVLGNESCDLDSAISALTYAFYLYKNNVDPELLPVPMLNIHQEDFPLRTETKYFLKKNNICSANLIFRNFMNLSTLKSENRLILTLVDHHVLPQNDKNLKDCVSFIIDHRPVNNEEIACDKYKIEPVGSCCTLIAELFLAENDRKNYIEALYLDYATIILDTVNFNKEAKRFTEKDIKIIEEIEKILKTETKSSDLDKVDHESALNVKNSLESSNFILDRTQLFSDLVAARNDISTLTTFEVLQKDMKILDGIPIPGVPLLLSEVVKKPDFFTALKNLCDKFNSKILVPMGLKVENSVVYREVGVFTFENNCDMEMRNRIVDALKDRESLLDLEEISGHGIEGLVLFKQNNVKMSRKHIVPIIKKVIQDKRC